jgi:hypothetical protein
MKRIGISWSKIRLDDSSHYEKKHDAGEVYLGDLGAGGGLPCKTESVGFISAAADADESLPIAVGPELVDAILAAAGADMEELFPAASVGFETFPSWFVSTIAVEPFGAALRVRTLVERVEKVDGLDRAEAWPVERGPPEELSAEDLERERGVDAAPDNFDAGERGSAANGDFFVGVEGEIVDLLSGFCNIGLPPWLLITKTGQDGDDMATVYYEWVWIATTNTIVHKRQR